MTIIYFIVGSLSGLFGLRFFPRYTRNETLLSLLTVITIVFFMGIAKQFIVPVYRATTYAFFLKHEDPSIKLIGSKFPDEYAKYLYLEKQSILNIDRSNFELLYKINFLNSVFSQCLRHASNESIYQYFTDELALYKRLVVFDPSFVLFLEFPNQFTNKPDPVMLLDLSGETIMNRIIQTKTAVILSAINNPQPPLTKAEINEASKLVTGILAKLSDQFGGNTFSDTMQHPANPIDKHASAALIISFYQAILDLGEYDTGIILKYITPQP
jgi:hypothetical protein